MKTYYLEIITNPSAGGHSFVERGVIDKTVDASSCTVKEGSYLFHDREGCLVAAYPVCRTMITKVR